MRDKTSFSAPRLGIIWFVPTTGKGYRFTSLANDCERVSVIGGFKTVDEGHVDTWSKVVAADRRLSRYDYEYFPRGRVNWRQEDNAFLLLADPRIFDLKLHNVVAQRWHLERNRAFAHRHTLRNKHASITFRQRGTCMSDGLHICIHRGTNQIGGSCVEMQYAGKRIVVVLGLPLDAELEATELPDIPSVHNNDGSLMGLLLSHGHRDHWGLLPKLPSTINVCLGRKTLSIMAAAAPFIPGGYAPVNSVTYEDGKPFELGPFTITPRLMDHSGFDAYGFLIEAGGKRVYYSGDIRGHGRKAALFERFVKSPPARSMFC
ncbi:MBL fold metallo-hydrolase [Rhizobium sp. NZLR10]|uniref:MBL fold metallo-hydrolase n=1 Tax=Rhizobium sp. NZLR10 TaxID=2731097 RepID=UPI002180C70B|nr:MBL fold metallo-hydrolase [Rhizobium sp. NZLR10]